MSDALLSDASPDGGQVLYNLAMGAQPEDFPPALQPLAQGYSLLFQPQPTQAPGLLGSANDIDVALASTASPVTDEPADDSKGQAGPAPFDDIAGRIRQRDVDYLDRYYDPVSRYAQQFGVDPTLVLGLGIESGFGTRGTYNATGDAFGMTGGSTSHMTTATSPEDNVHQFFGNFGSRIRGVGSDPDAFIDALQARDAKGNPIKGVNPYNSDKPVEWEKMARDGIGQMKRDLPVYLPMRPVKPQKN